ncbi:hypothetical protein [Morganella morganii]
MSKLILRNILAYSISSGKFFSTDFGDSVNIIHGRNTSGKSTLMQSILYSMGVNDSKENLTDIINENVIFRLECEVKKIEKSEKVTFVRSDDTLIVRISDALPERFDGINGNNSFEYGKYKELFNILFDFKLKLLQQTNFVSAPIEAAFLPYYISQSVGWVYLRESVGDYRFYKDFKFDYLDYYTGLKDDTARLKKYTLQKEKQQLEYEKEQLIRYKSRDNSLKISEVLEYRLKGETFDYLTSYNSLISTFISDETKYNSLCNKLSMLRGRQKVLLQTIRNLKLQKPRVDKCPVCEQTLPGDIRKLYIYNQDINDALKQKDSVSDEIKEVSSSLNSTEKKIKENSKVIKNKFNILKSSRVKDVTYENWISHHSNIELLNDINEKAIDYDKKISKLEADIKNLGSDMEINSLRHYVEKEFLKIFEEKAKLLDIKIPNIPRYQYLYSITSFPYQGVELHKIIMAYHFSFYQLISKRDNLHEFPFLLDAIFKEDIDVGNRDLIFNFLGKESENKNQLLFTVAEYEKDENPLKGNPLFNINEVNKKYFSGNAKQICIGGAKSVRSFLFKKELNDNDRYLLDDAFYLLETI